MINVREHQQRRERVLAELKNAGGAVAIYVSGDASTHGFKPDASFLYLTGIADEAGASVLFDPENPDPKRRCVLFLRPLNPEMEAWDGYRDELGSALRERYGFTQVMRTTHLPRMLTQAVRMRKRVALLHPLAVYDAPVSPDLALFRKVMERVPGVAIEDRSELLPTLRSVKSEGELAVMRRAIEATARGFEAALATIKPGINERDVQRAIEREFVQAGGSGTAYESIVGSGKAGTVLHYRANSAELKAGDLLVIDAGASVDGYAADITRTYPVNGKFTARQREIYDLVLRAQEASIASVRPGAWLHEVDEAAREVFRRAGIEDRYLHGIGHHLGIEVHDASPTRPLEAGNVVTIEPGLYLPGESLGVRIEDDVLVTAGGREVLSPQIEKDAGAIERRMGAR